MLLQIRDYIDAHGQVSAQQLCRHFAIAYSALEPMLDRWEQAGLIKAIETQTACAKKCMKCSDEPIIYYQIRRR